jgi:hypothetical protein
MLIRGDDFVVDDRVGRRQRGEVVADRMEAVQSWPRRV